ncbi:hypothetical protein KIN20_014405 [Parelaphostrongylus tenuis]|uniref:Alpha N-terminal protein methyltransferase 1 n=1 Tax=Parelaphostrongylus tenuis TaxID=148309 RepID=A0AAD5QPE0_PARTN|nr:hypothetical protein KIN20_014405 [Parelaphostrongylus tenuis]
MKCKFDSRLRLYFCTRAKGHTPAVCLTIHAKTPLNDLELKLPAILMAELLAIHKGIMDENNNRVDPMETQLSFWATAVKWLMLLLPVAASCIHIFGSNYGMILGGGRARKRTIVKIRHPSRREFTLNTCDLAVLLTLKSSSLLPENFVFFINVADYVGRVRVLAISRISTLGRFVGLDLRTVSPLTLAVGFPGSGIDSRRSPEESTILKGLSGRLRRLDIRMASSVSKSDPVDPEEVYRKAYEFWSNTSRDIDGMLGGFANLHKPDIKCSKAFINKLKTKRLLVNANRVADCGAGIGRVTRHLLLPIFKNVVMVEPVAELLERSRSYVTMGM